jgi:hypothetical protein
MTSVPAGPPSTAVLPKPLLAHFSGLKRLRSGEMSLTPGCSFQLSSYCMSGCVGWHCIVLRMGYVWRAVVDTSADSCCNPTLHLPLQFFSSPQFSAVFIINALQFLIVITITAAAITPTTPPRHHHFRSSTKYVASDVQCDSKLLSEFPWPIIFKPETRNETAFRIRKCKAVLIL